MLIVPMAHNRLPVAAAEINLWYTATPLKHENYLPRAGLWIPLADMTRPRFLSAVDRADLIALAKMAPPSIASRDARTPWCFWTRDGASQKSQKVY